MEYINSYNISIKFDPWFSKGYRFTKLRLYEELGGDIGKGEMDLVLDGSSEALDLITKQHTGTIELKKIGGNIYTIDIFIVSRKYYKNNLTIEFLCIKDKKFLTELVSTEWTDINKALPSLYPGKIDIKCESDVNNNIKIYQNGETNYSLCNKLCYSYKHDAIFSFGWEGLVIKDLKECINNKVVVKGNTLIHSMDSYNINYDKLLYYSPEDPWDTEEYKEKQSKNIKSLLHYSKYNLVGTEYYQLLSNYYWNKRYMNSNLFESFRAMSQDMPPYKLGDVIKYNNDIYLDGNNIKLPFDTFLIKSNELFISIEGSGIVDENGLYFSWISKLVGLQDIDGKLLSSEDPY